jgi:adenylate cyclase
MLNCLAKGRKPWLLAIVLAACLAAEALFQAGALNAVDLRLQDFWFQWQGKRAEARHVAIVALDEETLSAYPDDPMVFWSNRFAVAVARLREVGVKVIGLDMLLSTSPERWLGSLGGELQEAARSYDQPFREQLNSGQLILAATRQGAGSRETDYLLPSPDYLLALPDFDIPGYVALADLFDENDGVVRRYRIAPVEQYARATLGGDAPIFGLPALLAIRATGESPRAQSWTLGGRNVSLNQAPQPIPYIGPPGSFPLISLKRLLADDALADAGVLALRDKVVLIGASAAMNDEHFTPYATRLLSGRGALMNGVELHANVLESLLSGYRLEPLGNTTRIVALIALTTVAVLAFAAIPAWSGALVWLLV